MTSRRKSIPFLDHRSKNDRQKVVFVKAVALCSPEDTFALHSASVHTVTLVLTFHIFFNCFLLFLNVEQRLGIWWLLSFESSHFTSWKPNTATARTKIKPWNTSLVKVGDREENPQAPNYVSMWPKETEISKSCAGSYHSVTGNRKEIFWHQMSGINKHSTPSWRPILTEIKYNKA